MRNQHPAEPSPEAAKLRSSVLHLGTEPSCRCFTHHPAEHTSEWHRFELLPPATLPQGRICQQPSPAPGSWMKAPCERQGGSSRNTRRSHCALSDGHRSGGLTGSFPSLDLTDLWLLPSCFKLWHGCFPPGACTKGNEEPQCRIPGHSPNPEVGNWVTGFSFRKPFLQEAR